MKLSEVILKLSKAYPEKYVSAEISCSKHVHNARATVSAVVYVEDVGSFADITFKKALARLELTIGNPRSDND